MFFNRTSGYIFIGTCCPADEHQMPQQHKCFNDSRYFITMTDQELTEIETRCDAASPAPWKSFIEGRDHESGSSFIMTGIASGDDIWSKNRGNDIYLSGATDADQDFIAAARQDIPLLLEEIRKLNRELSMVNNSR